MLAVGLMIVVAFFGTVAFKRYRVPDVLLLILLGVLLGPVLGILDVEVFRTIAPIVGTVAIIIILFDGGLEMKFKELRRGVARGMLLAALVFAAATLLCALVLHTLAGLSSSNALLLGMVFGGAGAVIVIPLIQNLHVQDRTRTIVSLEAASSDVFVVTGVYAVATALAFQQAGPGDFARNIVATFSTGILAGTLVGYAWARILRGFPERSYEYVLTLAMLFLTYAVVELFNGSGPIAVLAAGLVLGNSRKTQRVTLPAHARRGRRSWEFVPVFGVDLQNLHHEMVFFIRAFFFVALGVALELDAFAEPTFLLVGIALTIAIALARFWSATIAFWGMKLTRWDDLAVRLMFPVGLAAAALSLVPSYRFNLAGTERFSSYAAVVIILTNLTSSLLVYVASRPEVRRRITGLDPTAAAASPRGAPAGAHLVRRGY